MALIIAMNIIVDTIPTNTVVNQLGSPSALALKSFNPSKSYFNLYLKGEVDCVQVEFQSFKVLFQRFSAVDSVYKVGVISILQSLISTRGVYPYTVELLD